MQVRPCPWLCQDLPGACCSYRARCLPLCFTRHAWPSATTVSRFHLLGHNILQCAIQHRTAYRSHVSTYPHSGAAENLKQQIASSHAIAVVGDGRTQRPVHANITAVSGVTARLRPPSPAKLRTCLGLWPWLCQASALLFVMSASMWFPHAVA